MAKTYFDGKEVKKWFVDGREVKKAYFNNQLVFSSGFELVISASNHNVPANWIWTLLPPEQQQAQGNTIKIIVNQGVELVTASTAIVGVFDFAGAWAGKTVIIENHGFILGRGGNGGPKIADWTSPGLPGGRAIYHANVLTSLSIDNQGTIAGGGGGGGSTWYDSNYRKMNVGGGGGAPFGLGLSSADAFKPGGNASLTTGGSGGYNRTHVYGGAGGNWGIAGGVGMYNTPPSPTAPGGAAGEATRGTITWINRGDIRGATV